MKKSWTAKQDGQAAAAAMRQAVEYIRAAQTEMREAAIHFEQADKKDGKRWSADAATVRDFARQLDEFLLCDHEEAGFEAWTRIVEARS
jgi:hypothetical protein